MNVPSTRDTEVLIVGAGPTGLVMALWLTRLGVRVRIIDKTSEPGTMVLATWESPCVGPGVWAQAPPARTRIAQDAVLTTEETLKGSPGGWRRQGLR